MNTLPTGTVTFMFTDIEGSTGIAQAYPDQWETLRNRHHEILRSAIESNNGYVFQIVGDEFCAAFHTAPDALKAAFSAQQMLQAEAWDPAPIKVRMGINTGAAQVGNVDDASGGYTGYSALARVNRVMSAGHGGQILLSNASAELTRGELPPAVTLRDMGEQRLKGLLNTEHLWQVEVPGLMRDFPPLKTLSAIPNNLPAQLTSFIGREKEIAEVKEELNSHRLVTLVGPGGTGKSRLSLQLAADVLDAYPHGVWFIELASLSDPELVPQTILSAMSVSEQKGKTAQETLEEYLRAKNLLLILDNCEHLIEACAKISQAILKSVPNVKILASSRESLGVSREVSWHVPSLSAPNPKNLPEFNQLTQYESVRLFIDRVLLVSPRFAVTKENASAIAQVCYRLDGIPLALELAAARAKSMSVEQIMSRLDDRFRLLTGGSRTALPRQQTLRALIDWSYDLLTDLEKLLLRRLAVFSGGWTLELAEQICGDEKLDALDILDMLGHLVDKSLVAVEEENGNTRYRILETIRQYAREKLFESGDGVEMRNRHCKAFVKLVEQVEPELFKNNGETWLRRLDAEQENIRAALWWAVEIGDGNCAMRICNALNFYWLHRGLASEAVNYLNEVVLLVEKDEILCRTAGYGLLLALKIELMGGVKLNFLTEPFAMEICHKATRLLQELNFPAGSWHAFGLLTGLFMTGNNPKAAEENAVKLLDGARAAGNEADVAWALSALADLNMNNGNLEKCDEMDSQARDIFFKLGYDRFALQHSGALSYRDLSRGNLVRAQKNFEANLYAYRELMDEPRAKYTLWHLADIAILQGEYDLAKKYYQEANDYSSKSGNQAQENIYIQVHDGWLALITGELEKSRQTYEALFKALKEMQWDEFAGFTMGRYGLVLFHSGQIEEARNYFEKSIAQMEKVGGQNNTGVSWYGLAEVERVAGNFPAATRHYQRSLFLRNKLQEYIHFSEIFDNLAKLFLLQNDFVQSARWFGCSDALRKKFGIVIPPVDRPDYDKHIELLKSKMSTEEFESAWEEGAKIHMNAAVALALQGYEP
ncbi:MAG: tetratricopeptide repeat protein [Anaerolineales bacterium]|uniref:tetratricopeptide repeat protein n=1 Tax=Candidatus Villigracilis proximus TaxID=3140683 RepID=UPI0031376B2A|nr:tetratricopeptide repeat protein [Anaerolineales bacterium]